MRPSLSVRRDERGSILILSTVGVIVAMISAALAVDLGRLAQSKRFSQKVADMAALDASRDLNRACAIAKESAVRNNFDPVGLDCIDPAHNPTKDVVIGRMVGGNFTPDPTGDAVKVRARSGFEAAFPFVSGPDGVSVKAIAKISPPEAGFSIGSSLANFSSADNVVLNKVLGGLFDNPGAVNLGALTYQGLATSTIKLGDLATEMGFGSVDSLLTADVTLGQVLSAAATVLNNQDTALAASVNQLVAAVRTTTTFKLGDFIAAQQGSGVAAGTGIHLLNLITASAELANQNHFVEVAGALTLPVTGVGSLSTKLGLTLIEPARTYIGPVGGSVETAQVNETFTPTLNANPLGVGLLTVSGDIPVTLSAAGATGTLDSVACLSPQGIGVGVSATPVTTSVSTTLTVHSLGIPVASVKVGPASANSASASNSVSFAYPGEFTPPATPKSTPAVPPGLTLTGGQITVTVLGLLPLGVTTSSIANAVLGIVNNTVTAVSAQVLSPTFASMGLKLGQVDVAALEDAFDPTTCGHPGLVG